MDSKRIICSQLLGRGYMRQCSFVVRAGDLLSTLISGSESNVVMVCRVMAMAVMLAGGGGGIIRH